MPKRLRWYLEREPRAGSAVPHILLHVIEAHLRLGKYPPEAAFVAWMERSGIQVFAVTH